VLLSGWGAMGTCQRCDWRANSTVPGMAQRFCTQAPDLPQMQLALQVLSSLFPRDYDDLPSISDTTCWHCKATQSSIPEMLEQLIMPATERCSLSWNLAKT